jgi:hypothetical protein
MPLRHTLSLGVVALLAAAFVFLVWPAVAAQPQPLPQPQPTPVPVPGNFYQQPVGGISINAKGLLDNATVAALNELAKARAKTLAPVSADLNRSVALRKISLRGLEEAIQKCIDQKQPLPDEVLYLAGLQQIRYVFVYGDQKDIVLAGPGEGWKADAKGNIVGATTGRPVLLLDDLLIALRFARVDAGGEITCSIDPTPEGIQRLRAHVAKLRTIGKDPKKTAAGIEQALGRQTITLHGVPDESHFARVLVAADYRMKRLAMDFEPSPIKGLPSFLQLMKVEGHGMKNMLPRWWLAPQYEAIFRDADGLAWELRGASVKAMTEADFLTAAGNVQHSGKADPTAQQWADNMTRQYDRLSTAEPIFGEVRNCADLAVVGALIAKENLIAKAGCKLPLLLDESLLKTGALPAPKEIDSKVSMLKKGDDWVISASGGIKIALHAILGKIETSEKLPQVRNEAALAVHKDWWWN